MKAAGAAHRSWFERIPAGWWATIIVLLAMPLFANNFWLFQVMGWTFIMGMIAISLTFLAGYGGMVSLLQMTVAGLGGYGVAILGTLTLPTGDDDAFMGESGVTSDIQLIGDFHVFGLGAGLMLGWRHRFDDRFVGATLFRDQLLFGLGVKVPVPWVEGLGVTIETRGEVDARLPFLQRHFRLLRLRRGAGALEQAVPEPGELEGERGCRRRDRRGPVAPRRHGPPAGRHLRPQPGRGPPRPDPLRPRPGPGRPGGTALSGNFQHQQPSHINQEQALRSDEP